jgi:hypothetical protein
MRSRAVNEMLPLTLNCFRAAGIIQFIVNIIIIMPITKTFKAPRCRQVV